MLLFYKEEEKKAPEQAYHASESFSLIVREDETPEWI